MKHQLDATLCRFYFCRVTLHVSGASAYHQEYLKLVQRPLVHVLSLQVSHHISLLGPEVPALIRRCDDSRWWALAPETCRVTLQKYNLHSVASSWCFIWLTTRHIRTHIRGKFFNFSSFNVGTVSESTLSYARSLSLFLLNKCFPFSINNWCSRPCSLITVN